VLRFPKNRLVQDVDLHGGHDLGSRLTILVRDRTLRLAVVHLVLGASPVLDIVTIMLFTLHDAMDGARGGGGVLAIVVQTTSKLSLFAPAMALVDVTASATATLVPVKVGA
jgi:hypothetical protein